MPSTFTAALLSLFLAGCDDRPAPEDTGPVDADADGWTIAAGDCDDGNPAVNPDALEDCGGGVDDDCDGLADCEDGDCAVDYTCVEDCESLGDEDGDGLADCEDDDCWYWNCIFHSRVQEGGRAHWTHWGSMFGGAVHGTATSIHGTVMVSDWYLSSAPVFTCSWHAAAVAFSTTWQWSTWDTFDQSTARASRFSFVLSPDCPFTRGASFLPALVPSRKGLGAWDRTSGWYVESLRSWYVGSPVLLSQSTQGSHYYSEIHHSWWSMAPFAGGGTFVKRLTPPREERGVGAFTRSVQQ